MRGRGAAIDAVRTADEIILVPIVLGELKAGFMRGRRRKTNEEELREFMASPRVRTVPVDEQTADRYALILDDLRRSGTPIPTNDLWIAASAMQHGLRVVTSDAHFQRVHQIVVDFLETEQT